MTSEDIKSKLMETLKRNNLKLTRQRLKIIEVLAGDRSHPSARIIFHKVRQKVPSVSLSTVYYTLNLFKRDGSIKELEFYDMDNRYDVNVLNHINLICKRCGKIEDFTEELPFSSETIEEQTGFRPVGMRFEYYGYCKGCRGKVR